MDRLTAARVFVDIVDRGSMAAAAQSLDMSRAMVTRYLAQMEQWAGVRLLHRSTRKLGLTADGEATLTRCRQMLELAGEIEQASHARTGEPRGMMRITCSQSLGQDYLAAAVAEYLRRYPNTCVDLLMSNAMVDLIQERIDLAVRITNDMDPNLIARKLTACRSLVCASPAYLAARGTPRRAEDLAVHNCLTYSYFGKSLWQFEKEGERLSVPVRGNLSANESAVLLAAALEGAGITLQPMYSVVSWLRGGQLVALLPGYKPVEMGVYGVYTSRRQMPAILRTMMDFLVERFATDPRWRGMTTDEASKFRR